VTGILFTLLGLCFLLGMPVAFALGIASVGAVRLGSDLPLLLAAQRLFTGTDSFALMAVPFFMLAGELMEAGGISRRLFDFAHALVGFVAGGLAMVSVAAAMFFAGISGSAAADTAAVGTLSIPAMVRKGYPGGFAAAVQAAGGTVGVIIPPSIPMILFGVVGGVSIGKLFLGGVIPGLLIGGALMAVSYRVCRRSGLAREPFRGFRELFRAFRAAAWALAMPLIILGGILGGVFTPTEAAVVAALYALAAGFGVYRELRIRALPRLFARAAVSTGTVMLLIATAGIFGWLVTSERIPQQVAQAAAGLTRSPAVFSALVLAFLLLVGTFMETSASLIILTPVLLPVAGGFGIDPVHFGVVMVAALAVGMLTPPLGICLFIASNIARIELSEILRYLGPFLIVMIGCLLLLAFVPDLVLFLPDRFSR